MIEFGSQKDLDCVFRHHSACSVSQRNTCDFVFLFTFTPRSRHVHSRRIVETFYFLSFSFRCVRDWTSTRKELGRIYSSGWQRGNEDRSLPRTTFNGISRNVCCKSTLIRKIRRVCARLNKLSAVPRDLSCWKGNHNSELYTRKRLKNLLAKIARWFELFPWFYQSRHMVSNLWILSAILKYSILRSNRVSTSRYIKCNLR